MWGDGKYLVLDIGAVVLRGQQVEHLAALGRDGVRADVRRRALGNAVEGARELVARELADLLRAIGVVVVERLRGAEGLDEGKVARAARRDDLAAGQDRELNRQAAGRGATAVDEDRVIGLLGAGQRHAELLVQRLADGRDADAERAGVLVRDVLGDLHLHVRFRHAVLGEAAVFFLDGVGAVHEA